MATPSCLLLAGMIMVAMLRATGAMQYAAIRMSKLSGHHPKLLFVYLCARQRYQHVS